MADRDYLSLVRIQQQMRNEISSLSMSGNQFLEYVHGMETGRMGINGALKALLMLEDLESRTGQTESLAGASVWIDALCKATADSRWQKLFVNLDFEEPLEPEFEGLQHQAALDINQPSWTDWVFLMAAAAVFAGLLALLVLWLHCSYWLSVLLCATGYGAVIWWYFTVAVPRRRVHMLKRARRATCGEIRRFLAPIRLPGQNRPSERAGKQNFSKPAGRK